MRNLRCAASRFPQPSVRKGLALWQKLKATIQRERKVIEQRVDQDFGGTQQDPVGANPKKNSCLVEFRDVTLHFGEKTIFDDLNLAVRSGECLVLLGPSGIGKSTLLRLLLETLRPERGLIFFDGVELTHLSRERLNDMRTRIGMVFQSSALVSSLSVSENLALPLRELTRKGEKEIASIIEEKLHFVGLEKTKDLMPSQLSGGMKKRIAVARALVLNPDLVLFDEPTTGLDPMAAYHISKLIMHLNHAASVTILVVTHDLHSAFRFATRIAILDQGRIVEEGLPEAIRQSRNPIVARFLTPGSEDCSSEKPNGFVPLDGLMQVDAASNFKPKFLLSNFRSR
jgi:phospholipid/cholesterol/gamma-HCH transport system ATP-binding protein